MTVRLETVRDRARLGLVVLVVVSAVAAPGVCAGAAPGGLDRSSDSDGILMLDQGGSDAATGVAVERDGRIVLVGSDVLDGGSAWGPGADGGVLIVSGGTDCVYRDDQQ